MSLHSNDPCHCGSGKKYRQCCMNQDYSAENSESLVAAVQLVIQWLDRYHRKALEVTCTTLVESLLSKDELKGLSSLGDSIFNGILNGNLNWWMVAEGHLFAKGERRRISDYLLGTHGPALTSVQRNWLTQLSQVPLRLYMVTEVVSDSLVAVCDVLDPEALPVVVHETFLNKAIIPGDFYAWRLMRVDTHFELSQDFYGFNLLDKKLLFEGMQAVAEKFTDPQESAYEMGRYILREWMLQFKREDEAPYHTDFYTDDPIILITDFYTVDDWSALESVLATCEAAESDVETGWMFLKKYEDSEWLRVAHIDRGHEENTLLLFTKTLRIAKEARHWLENLVPGVVHFVKRDEMEQEHSELADYVDPADFNNSVLFPDIDQMGRIMERSIHRIYGNWADQSLPELGNKTPRQAMQTPAGLERVKAVIRGYEAKEKKLAREHKRHVVSYGFLWQSLGLTS